MKTCKVEGCCRPVRGRGMCINHYEKWRVANPGVRNYLLNEKTVEDLLPATMQELVEATGMWHQAVKRALTALHEKGVAHIGTYDPPTKPGGRWLPVWVKGNGTHARRHSPAEWRAYRNKCARERYNRRRLVDALFGQAA